MNPGHIYDFYRGYRYNLNSERWRKPVGPPEKAVILNSEHWRRPEKAVISEQNHSHFLDLKDSTMIRGFSCGSEEDCVFCQANLFDRTLDEIFYHLYRKEYRTEVVKTLIDKWKNNVDTWRNPIGNNIKG